MSVRELLSWRLWVPTWAATILIAVLALGLLWLGDVTGGGLLLAVPLAVFVVAPLVMVVAVGLFELFDR